jgi:hypothetical protein
MPQRWRLADASSTAYKNTAYKYRYARVVLPMQEYETPDSSDGIRDAGESPTDFVSAGWALCLIGIALLLILRTI